MNDPRDENPLDFLSPLVEPWYEALKKPDESQRAILKELLESYAKTEYGAAHGASSIEGMDQFQRNFPIVKYRDLEPYLERVRKGNYSALLPEPVVRWVMTRGSTGVSKVIPATQTHLSQILTLGARGIINFAITRNDPAVLQGYVLNLNFPSEVNTILTDKGGERYGYSSGTYAKLNPQLGDAGLLPRQEEIDALGGGVTKLDWERRFELVYQKAKGEDIRSFMGVTPVIAAFARYTRKKHGVLPRELWKMKALFCTSVAKIQTSYAPYMQELYGDAPIVELYTATEGIFGQQLDERPYISPNYDAYFFEAATRRGVFPLHGLRRGEWGRLIISGPLFPRYDIGDLIESMGKGYFRVFGRAKALTYLEHHLFNIVTGRILKA